MTTNTNTINHRQLHRMYKIDWMVERKYGMLMLLVGMVGEGADEPGDIEIAIRLTNEIEYLISVSKDIPDDFKETLTMDNEHMREFFQKLSVVH